MATAAKKNTGPGYAAIKAEFLIKKAPPSSVETPAHDEAGKVETGAPGTVTGAPGTVTGAAPDKPCPAPDKERPKRERGNKRKRGMNSARTKKEMGLETAHSLNLCREFCKIGTCSFGEKCHYDHDIQKYKTAKPKDLADTCYMYETYGQCPDGFNCRFADVHSDWKNGVQKRRLEEQGGVVEIPQSLNNVSQELRAALRRHTYKFSKAYKAKNPHNPHAHKSRKSKSKVCFAWRKGECDRGDGCRFAHKEDIEEKPTPAPTPEVAEETKAATAPAAEVSAAPNTTAGLGPGTVVIKDRKKVDFTRKVFVAPLTTVGNLPFRRIVKSFGADITCGEMALSLPLIKGQNSEWALLRRHPCEDVFGCQIAGNKSELMGRLSEVIENEMNVDFVDLNLGCPIDVVCSRGMGAAMMQRPNHLLHALEEMAPHLSVPISVKMRAGWTPNSPSAHKLVHKVQLWNSNLSKSLNSTNPVVSAISIHGRSRLQRYTKEADWNYIRQCRIVQNDKLPPIQIIGNGDVYSYTDWERRISETGVSTCLLARGVLQKPWLCTEIKEKRHWDISATERLDIYKNFVHYGLEHWGSDQRGVNRVRRFLLEWLSFTYRYIPVGLLERIPVQLNERAPAYRGRSDLEILLASPNSSDWVKITEMLLGPVPEGFKFVPKHKANAYSKDAER